MILPYLLCCERLASAANLCDAKSRYQCNKWRPNIMPDEKSGHLSRIWIKPGRTGWILPVYLFLSILMQLHLEAIASWGNCFTENHPRPSARIAEDRDCIISRNFIKSSDYRPNGKVAIIITAVVWRPAFVPTLKKIGTTAGKPALGIEHGCIAI